MSRYWRTAILAAGAAVLVGLVVHEGGSLVAGMLWRIGWGFALLMALRAGYVGLRAAALHRVVPRGLLTYRELWWIRLSTEAVEMVTLTGPFLAEPAKGWLLKRRGLSTAEAVGSVLVEYFLYTLVAAWVTAAALVMLLERSNVSGAVRESSIGILCTVALLTAGFGYAAVSGKGLIGPGVRLVGDWLGGGRGAAAAARLEPGERMLVSFLKRDRRHLLQMIAIQLAAQVLLTLEVWVVFHALRTGSSLADAFVFEGSIKFADVAFFFVPGQLGAHEGVYSVMAGALGIAPAVGLTLSLARRIRGVLVGSVAVFGRVETMSATASPSSPSR
jgi:hypothetical protein